MNTVCDRDWPEDFEHENGEYMNTCCECKNTFTGHKRRFICKACSTSQGGEAVEVVGYHNQISKDWSYVGRVGWEPLMTVAQHQRILDAATHPADQVADDLTMVKVSRELLEQIAVELEHDNDRYFLGRELRALLAAASPQQPLTPIKPQSTVPA